jgi:hypothetical protein
MQRKIVTIQVYQIDREQERRLIHRVRLETQANRRASDASFEPTFFKSGLCRTGEDVLKIYHVLLRIPDSEHSRINVRVPTIIWHLAAFDTVS